ncbi:MAG TPA: AMP-binding protein, partial [Acidimicrobiia bacterium]|nr:AMP-binding protein [Acidimicrobiia bacterium]
MQPLPAPDDVVLPRLLERNARARPDAPFAGFEDGGAWTCAEARDAAARAAGALAAAGVRPGDRVALFAPNGADWLRAWWGTTWLRAVVVPVNTAYRGEMLRHVCTRSGAVRAVVAAGLAPRFPAAGLDLPCTDVAGLAGGAPLPPADPAPEVWDTHSIMFTSGTTGPAKGSITSYLQLHMTGKWFGSDVGLGPDDVWLLDLPLFHQAAQAACAAALAVGAQVAVRSAPSMADYWAVARQTGATIALGVSAMAKFLLAQPPGPADRDHRLRIMAMSPLPPDPPAFVERFGLEGLITAYGSTEVSAALVSPLGLPLRPGTCGVPRPGVEIRIVDEHDVPVPPGEVGELVVRAERPWELSGGYVGDPGATVAAWRNGWFHTGDAFRAEPDGYYVFHDRYKDALRRRGENISSFEVERELLAHPAVAEAACVAVPGDLADDEVKVFLVPVAGADLDLAQLVGFLAGRMAHFMVPRYYEVVDALPKTETMRVRKHVLRERGNGPATWDREAAGLRVTRAG